MIFVQRLTLSGDGSKANTWGEAFQSERTAGQRPFTGLGRKIMQEVLAARQSEGREQV